MASNVGGYGCLLCVRDLPEGHNSMQEEYAHLGAGRDAGSGIRTESGIRVGTSGKAMVSLDER